MIKLVPRDKLAARRRPFSRRDWWATAIAILSVAFIGCGGGDDSAIAVGAPDGHCYPNGTCNAGLTCLSNLCVLVPSDDGGADGGAGDATVGDATVPDANADASHVGDAAGDVSTGPQLDASLDTGTDVDAGIVFAPWANDLGGGYIEGVSLDGIGGVLAAGAGYNGGSGAMLGRFDAATGAQMWLASPPNAAGVAVAADHAGNSIFILWNSVAIDLGMGSLAPGSIVAKYLPNGTLLWATTVLPAANGYLIGLSVDSSNHIWIEGQFANSYDFGGGMKTSAGQDDILLLELDDSDNYVSAQLFGDDQEQNVSHILVDATDHVILTGAFEGDVDFGQGTMVGVSNGSCTDIYMARFDASGVGVASTHFSSGGENTVSRGIAVSAGGDVATVGTLDPNTTMNLGGGVLSSGGATQAFVGVFSSDLQYQWGSLYGDGQHGASGMTVAFDSNGDAAAVIEYLGTITIGARTLTNSMGNSTPTVSAVHFTSVGNFGSSNEIDVTGNLYLSGMLATTAASPYFYFGGGFEGYGTFAGMSFTDHDQGQDSLLMLGQY